MSSVFVIATIEIVIPDALSLKGKRHILKSLIEKMRARTNASVAETDFNDLWQRAQISFAVVGSSKDIIEKQLSVIQNILDDCTQIETTCFDCQYI